MTVASKVERPGRVASAPRLPPTTMDMSSLLLSQSVRPCGVSVRPCTVPSLRRSAWASISFASVIFLSLKLECPYVVCAVKLLAIVHAAFLTVLIQRTGTNVQNRCIPTRMYCINIRGLAHFFENNFEPEPIVKNGVGPVNDFKKCCQPLPSRLTH